MMSAPHQSDHRETDPLRLLENWLYSSDGRFAPDTAAAATGLSVDEITTALLTLVERYECRLQLDEASGAVVVQFTVPLVRLRPHENSFAGMVKTLGKTALRLGRVLYKASLGLVLTAYSVVYAVMLMGDDSGGIFWFVGWGDDEKKKK
jgi:hypothetical protein